MSSSKKFGKSVILTGAAGFVGKNMTREFLAQDYHVVACDMNQEELNKLKNTPGDLDLVQIDMLKEDLVPLFKRVVEESEEAYMVNIAGLFKFDAPPMPLFLINVRLTKNVMDAALKVGGWKHVIHISTVGCYGTPCKNRNSSPWLDYRPYCEEDPKIPDNVYGVTKHMGEKCAWRYHERGLPISVVRPSLIYGPENRYGMGLFHQLASYCKNFWSGPLKYILLIPIGLPCRGATFAHFVHVDDISRACALILSKDEAIGETYTVGDPTPVNTIFFFDLMLKYERLKFNWAYVPLSRFFIRNYSKIFNRLVNKLLETILRPFFKLYGLHMGYNPNTIPLEIAKDWIGYFQSNYIWDISKLKSLGFKHKHPSLKRGVLETVIWYKKNNWLP